MVSGPLSDFESRALGPAAKSAGAETFSTTRRLAAGALRERANTICFSFRRPRNHTRECKFLSWGHWGLSLSLTIP
jgi:hypothetical protein